MTTSGRRRAAVLAAALIASAGCGGGPGTRDDASADGQDRSLTLYTCVNDTTIQPVIQAFEKTGAEYVDMSVVSEGHDACQPIGTRWIEPVLQGANPVIVHPNALGESQMAAQAMAVLHLR